MRCNRFSKASISPAITGNHFEWDTAKAAQAHWLDTARQIIRSVLTGAGSRRPYEHGRHGKR
jgi:hypothetical protein